MSDLTRRSFFGAALGGFFAACGLSRPGGRLFSDSYPAPNRLVTPEWVTQETARSFVEQLEFAGSISRHYDSTYRVGKTVKVGLPASFRVPA